MNQALERKTFIPFGETADHSIDFLLGVIEDARITTLQRVNGISKEALHWQYADGWNTIGALLSHIICVRHYFRIVFIEGKELTEAENEKYLPGLDLGEHVPSLITDDPIEAYLERLDASNKELVKAVSAIERDAFFKKHDYYNPNTGANLAWVLYHLAEDEVHHRGQISLILKLHKAITAT